MASNKKEHNAEAVRIGATLAFIRKQREVSQEELANALNISRPLLANIEKGRRNLNPALARQVAKILGVRPIVLVNEEFLRRDLNKNKSA